ncbi:Uma2 family endonuclease [Actinoplanes lutulentus]|uniref:Uma2 family endonuclease n=1 Tax=Actinoplanes lutulentus TaxID=1287878 RepID=A0A327Z6M0_9ACTN|nr:Uma2 family endonuclease [Actinoplanes lutulentus]MBB2942205.1 Uma2 family endonuclease [Actinoplanes lutulentus]RAK32974.1 Uma2 family endonuclease [Actinoplanes lutulentus]
MSVTLHVDLAALLARRDLTVDDIADLPEDLRYELIDGRLVVSPLALPIHQFIAFRIAVASEERCPEGVLVNGEQAVLLDRRNELRPDVVLIYEEGAGRSPVRPDDVPLVVEVISESSKKFDRDEKLKKYAYVGIRNYWIVDPLAERVTLTQFALGPGGDYQQLIQTDELVTVDCPWEITLDLPAWTRRRDRIRAVARPDS